MLTTFGHAVDSGGAICWAKPIPQPRFSLSFIWPHGCLCIIKSSKWEIFGQCKLQIPQQYKSDTTSFLHGLLWSFFGPLLFIIYILAVGTITYSHHHQYHFNTDDEYTYLLNTKSFTSFQPASLMGCALCNIKHWCLQIWSKIRHTIVTK